MDSKKSLPPSLQKLPRFSITPSPAPSRKDHERSDMAFGVRSAKDLQEQLKRGFASSGQPKPPSRKA